MEELGLRALHAGQELDVVHEQHVHGPVALAEFVHAVVLHRVHHLVLEPLGRDVGQVHLRVMRQDVMPDGVHQVRLPQPDAAVDEQGVVRAGRHLGHRPARGFGKLVRGAHDEGIERVTGIEAAERGNRGGRRIRARRNRLVVSSRGGLDRFGHIPNAASGAADFRQRLIDDGGVVPFQPSMHQRVSDPDEDRPFVVAFQTGRLEPRVERVLVDLGRDPLEHQLPDVPVVHDDPLTLNGGVSSRTGSLSPARALKRRALPRPRRLECRRLGPSGDFRQPGSARFRAFPRSQARPVAVFPHIFPHVWKTLGIDRTRRAPFGAAKRKEGPTMYHKRRPFRRLRCPSTEFGPPLGDGRLAAAPAAKAGASHPPGRVGAHPGPRAGFVDVRLTSAEELRYH